MAVCNFPNDPNYVPQLSDVGDCVVGIIKSFVAVASVAVLITFLWGIFKYITSRGDKEGVASAQATITYAMIGLGIVAVSFAIMTFIDQSLLGGTGFLLDFNIPTI
jgi:hypothetical protein